MGEGLQERKAGKSAKVLERRKNVELVKAKERRGTGSGTLAVLEREIEA